MRDRVGWDSRHNPIGRQANRMPAPIKPQPAHRETETATPGQICACPRKRRYGSQAEASGVIDRMNACGRGGDSLRAYHCARYAIFGMWGMCGRKSESMNEKTGKNGNPTKTRMHTSRPLPGVTGDSSNTQISSEEWAQGEALRLFSLLGDWQAVTVKLMPYLPLSRSAWWAVSRGRKITREKVNALLLHAGKLPLPDVALVECCPTCGDVHQAGDCLGKPVAEVVVLSPGEKVAPPGARVIERKQRKIKRWRDLPVRELAAALRNRQPY